MKYRELLGQLSKEYRNLSISYHRDENAYFTVFAAPLNSELEQILNVLYEKFDAVIGCSLRMFFCATDFRHLKEALLSLQHTEREFALANSSDAAIFQQVSL